MPSKCDGMTYKGKFRCTENSTWALTMPDARHGGVRFDACGQHLNQVAAFLTEGDDVSQRATRIQVTRVR